MDFFRYIRVVPDWPKKGINFKDITPLLREARLFRAAVRRLAQPFHDDKINVVVGIDARGFLLAGAVAERLRCGVALVRKGGKLPWHTIKTSYALEYGRATLEMHRDAVKSGEHVLIIDDILATGGTVLATTKLIEKLGGMTKGVAVLGTLDFLPGAKRVGKKYRLHTLIHFTS